MNVECFGIRPLNFIAGVRGGSVGFYQTDINARIVLVNGQQIPQNNLGAVKASLFVSGNASLYYLF